MLPLNLAPCKAKKRARRSRPSKSDAASAGERAAEDQDAIRLGSTRQAAIKALIHRCTKESWRMMVSHASWSNGYKHCALSDQLLASKHLWPLSLAPPSCVPTEQQEASSRMVT